jgi:hypothetical protein
VTVVLEWALKGQKGVGSREGSNVLRSRVLKGKMRSQLGRDLSRECRRALTCHATGDVIRWTRGLV